VTEPCQLGETSAHYNSDNNLSRRNLRREISRGRFLSSGDVYVQAANVRECSPNARKRAESVSAFPRG